MSTLADYQASLREEVERLAPELRVGHPGRPDLEIDHEVVERVGRHCWANALAVFDAALGVLDELAAAQWFALDNEE